MEPNTNPAPAPSSEPTTQPSNQPNQPSDNPVGDVSAQQPPVTEPVAVEPAASSAGADPSAANGSATTSEPAKSEPAAEASNNGTKRILLVEDDDSLANVYTQRLEAEGFDVRRVPNGEEALAAALNYKPDLVVLDVMMPKVSGFDVLDILRNTPETANLKIIMLTALSQESDLERAKQLGVDEYLVKSQVVIADVVDKIRAHV